MADCGLLYSVLHFTTLRVPRMKSNSYTAMEIELSEMIVSLLDLEFWPSDIRPEDPLFSDGLAAR